MAGDGGLNALSLLPENVLPQWQQKIALRAVCHFHPTFNVGRYAQNLTKYNLKSFKGLLDF